MISRKQWLELEFFLANWHGLSWLTLGSLLAAGCSFLLQVALASLLTPGVFGHWAAVWTALTLGALLAGWGAGGYWLKLLARAQADKDSLKLPLELFVSLSWMLAALVIACGLWLAWAFFSGAGQALGWPVIWLVLLSLPLQLVIELTSARLQWCEAFFRLALWQLLASALRLFCVGVLLLLGVSNPEYLAAAYAGVALLLLPLGLFWLWQPPISQAGWVAGAGVSLAKALREFLQESTPFALAGVLYLLYFQGGVLGVHQLAGASAAGLYQVALVVMSGIYLLPAIVVHKFMLPRLHRWAYSDEQRLLSWYQNTGYWLLAAGIALCVALLLLAPLLVKLLFGEAYDGSILLLMILALGVPLRFLTLASGAVLMTGKRMPTKARLLGAAWGVQLCLLLLLVPGLGAAGAAFALLGSDLVLFALHRQAVKKLLG